MRRITDLSPGVIEAIRQQWIAGVKAVTLAAQFDLSAGGIRQYARRHGWAPDKVAVRNALADKRPEAVAVRLIATAEDYVQQHTDDWQDLRRVATELLTQIQGASSARDQSALLHAVTGALKYVQDGQRKSLGLDKQTGGDGAGDHAAATQEIDGRVVSTD